VIATKIRAAWQRPWVRRTFLLAFLTFITLLLVRQGRTIEWNKVADSIRSYEASTLAMALALSAVSYLFYSSFDLLGRYYLGVQSRLSVRDTLSTAFVSFAFNQSIGSMIGAVAFRFRIYSKLGLAPAQISKILVLSVVSNWLGYSALAGIIFAAGAVSMPAGWDIGSDILRIIGAVLIVTACAYMLTCAFGRQKKVTFRAHSFKVPSFRLASLQLSLSALHWPATAGIIYLLLDGRAEFGIVMGALLLSAIATVMTHIPAGVGILEAIFIGLLRHRIPTTELLAALLVFRAVYHIAPLTIAALLYAKAESRDTAAVTASANQSEKLRSSP